MPRSSKVACAPTGARWTIFLLLLAVTTLAPRTGSGAPPVSAEDRQVCDQLVKLESLLLDLRTKYTEEHPRRRIVKTRIAEIKSGLDCALGAPFAWLLEHS